MKELDNFMITSPDHNVERLTLLQKIFPDLFTNEGQINIDEFKKYISPDYYTAPEQYEFKWFGKANSKRFAFKPTTATLKFDKERSVYPDKGKHIIIEGENLEVLKLLSSGYKNLVKCIYIDPPFNTGSDFIYNDNYTEDKTAYWEKSGSTEEGIKIDSNPESAGRYHSSWLSMMFSRLLIARNLLKPDGAIFVSIDDHEIFNIRKILDEVFGMENYRNTFIVRRYDKNINRQFIEEGLVSYNTGFEYIVCYSKSDEFKLNPIYKESSEQRQNYGYWKGFWNNANRPTMRYEIHGFKPETGQWKWQSKRGLEAVRNYDEYLSKYSESKTLEEYWIEKGKTLEFIRRNPEGKGKNMGVEHWIPPAEGILRNTNWSDMFASKTCEEIDGLFEYPKNIDVIKTIIQCCEENGDIILDFFAGSGSTGHAVLDLNDTDKKDRQFILVQLPEQIDKTTEVGAYAIKEGFSTISQITIERCKRVITGYKKKSRSINSGFKVYKLVKSNFPRNEFTPDPEKSAEENIELLKKYISAKELSLHTLFNNNDLFDEVLIKNGFTLTYSLSKKEEYLTNNVYFVKDDYQEALICLDSQIGSETIDLIRSLPSQKFICLELSLDTSKKWNLQNHLGKNLRTL